MLSNLFPALFLTYFSPLDITGFDFPLTTPFNLPSGKKPVEHLHPSPLISLMEKLSIKHSSNLKIRLKRRRYAGIINWLFPRRIHGSYSIGRNLTWKNSASSEGMKSAKVFSTAHPQNSAQLVTSVGLGKTHVYLSFFFLFFCIASCSISKEKCCSVVFKFQSHVSEWNLSSSDF